MKKRIPTYEDCKNIVNAKGDLIFYETIHKINNCKISVFNYRLANYTDFIDDEIDYREIRGLCFVFNSDETSHKRYLMLNKFWNINQVTETLYNNIKDLKIKSVYNKEDGSLLSFIKVNGRIIPKTKMGFDNDQTIEAEKIYNTNEKIRNFIDTCLNNNIVSFWEFVSFKNKIVLNYDEPNLILLKLRDNNTGEYLDIEKYRDLGFSVVKSINFTDLETLMIDVEKEKGIEGVVITFEDNYMVKMKSTEYFVKHKLLTEDANREDIVISMILNETIDDIKSQLDIVNDKEKIEWIEEIEEIVKVFMTERINEVNNLILEFKGDIKDFAIRNNKNKNFSLAITIIRGNDDVFKVVTNWLLNQTNKLEKARSFIKRKGFKRK